MPIVEFEGPPTWSLDVSETGEYKMPVGRCGEVNSMVKRPRWRPIELNDLHLRSHGK